MYRYEKTDKFKIHTTAGRDVYIKYIYNCLLIFPDLYMHPVHIYIHIPCLVSII